jgi:hypothetical protein
VRQVGMPEGEPLPSLVEAENTRGVREPLKITFAGQWGPFSRTFAIRAWSHIFVRHLPGSPHDL